METKIIPVEAGHRAGMFTVHVDGQATLRFFPTEHSARRWVERASRDGTLGKAVLAAATKAAAKAG